MPFFEYVFILAFLYIVKLSDAAIMLLGFMGFKGFIGIETLNILIKAAK